MKIPAVRDYILDILEGNRKVIVFAHHLAVLDALSEALDNKVSPSEVCTVIELPRCRHSIINSIINCMEDSDTLTSDRVLLMFVLSSHFHELPIFIDTVL